MTMTAKGVAKLVEECGELQAVLGKKLAYWSAPEGALHWDGTDLRERMIEEMGDVMAGIEFVSEQFGIAADVDVRFREKLVVYDSWEASSTNNTYGIDAPR